MKSPDKATELAGITDGKVKVTGKNKSGVAGAREHIEGIVSKPKVQKIKYEVGDKSYKLKKGELLWHKSNVKHRAINHSDKKAKYATVGTPPTFNIDFY